MNPVRKQQWLGMLWLHRKKAASLIGLIAASIWGAVEWGGE